MPAVAIVLGLCLAGVQASAEHVLLTDLAADAARIVARGDDPGVAAGRVSAGVAGATVSFSENGDLVCASVSAPVVVAGIDLGVSQSATACALSGGR